MRSSKVLTVRNLSCFIVTFTLLSYLLNFKKQEWQPTKYQEILKQENSIERKVIAEEMLTLYNEDNFLKESVSSDSFTCEKLTFVQDCHVCTYPYDQDKSVSNAVIKRRKYQPALTSLLMVLLSQVSNNCTFLDLGANIGYFSLLASCLGYKAIAFEAVSSNILRMYEAAKRSKSEGNIELYKNAVSGFESITSYVFEGDSTMGQRGNGQVLDDESDHNYLPFMYEAVTTTTLSTIIAQLFHHKSLNSILVRMDLGSDTCAIIKNDHQVFLKKLTFPYLLINWNNLLNYDPVKKQRVVLPTSYCSEEDVKFMIDFLFDNATYQAVDIKTRKQLAKSDLLMMHQDHVLWIHDSVPTAIKRRIIIFDEDFN